MTEKPLKVTTAKELKAEQKIVRVSSGHVYKIRKLPLTAMTSFLSLDFKVDFKKQLKDPEKAKKILEAMDSVLPVCLVEPKISSTPSENTVELVDIPSFDQIELFVAIVTHTGYTKEKMEEFGNFLKKPLGKSSTGPGTSNK